MRDDGNAIKDSRWREILACVLIMLAFYGNDWRTDAGTGSPLSHVFAANVELVGRREFVKRGIPFRARIWLVCEHELALGTRHRERFGPRVEFGVVDDLEDAGDRKIIVAYRRGVGRIAMHLPRGGAESIEKLAECSERVRSLFAHGLCHLLLSRCERSAAR